MRSHKYHPRAPLAAFVNCLWYWEGAPQTHAKERLLPNGEPSIIFNLQDEPIRIYDARDLSRYAGYGCAVFSGARSNWFAIDTRQEERVVGIQFRPGGSFPFFRAPASETEGISVSLEDLWPRPARDIRDRLLEASSVESMLTELERCLMEQVVRPLELHPAVAYALEQLQQPDHTGRVAAVAGQIGLSARRFIELFRRQVGLPPKTFYRVRRFQHVLQTVHRRKEADWAQVALECGYYDQPHFIHDFQSFSGLTPGKYLARATAHLNHVPLI